MTRIDRVVRLRDCGIYRDFKWTDDLPDFKRYNLIYGGNGTGKTTLSRLMRNLETRREPPEGTVVLRIDGEDMRGTDFPEQSVPIRVFNRDFIAENVFPDDSSGMPPILILGSDSIKKQQELRQLQQDETNVLAERERARKAIGDAAKDFDRFRSAQARDIKETLRSSGKNPYNTYDRTRYTQDAEQILLADDHRVHRLTDDARERAQSVSHSTPRRKLQILNAPLPDLSAIRDRVSQLLNRTVQSTVLESLRHDDDLASWTRRGLSLHRGRGTRLCLFCEQPFRPKRWHALEGHFSHQHTALMQALEEERVKISDFINDTQDTMSRLPRPAELYDDLSDEFRAAAHVLRDATRSGLDFLTAMDGDLERKQGEPFVPLAMTVALPGMDPSVVDTLNLLIGTHNRRCLDFESSVKEAREQLVRNAIHRNLGEFVRLRKARDKALVEEGEHDDRLEALRRDIKRLQFEMTDHGPPADELNEDLYHYLGHRDLQLTVEDSGYMIWRRGRTAKAVSEGERTAIALLYFLKSLRDRRFDSSNGIVVLDDPVSSLDANAMYLAASFIQERTKGAGQLVILTHNFAFFRRIRDWFRYEKKDRLVYFMMESRLEAGVRNSVIRELDPILRDYESEYHYLFACCHRAARGSGAQNLKHDWNLPNMGRRVLEVFLAFRFPQSSSTSRRPFWEKLNDVAFDAVRRRRIMNFLNAYSHGRGAPDPERDITGLLEAPAVMKDLLDLIKSEDPIHYARMANAVGETLE